MTHYPELTTIRDFARYATSVFNQADLYYGHGTDNAWDDAMALIYHTLHLPHETNPTVLDAHLIESERIQLFDLIKQRIEKRLPVPYLTHEAWFAGISFYVDERVLIPRSPIAELIQRQFMPWMDHEIENILDLCTGSGCIAIACAYHFTDAHIDATDISEDALAVAKINVLRHGKEDQVSLCTSDLFNDLPQKKYDLIVSNPPYVNTQEMVSLPQEYRHEPALGLAAGISGLDIVKRILKQASAYLKPNGMLVVEVGNSEQALQADFPDVPFTWPMLDCGGNGIFILTAEQVKKIHDNHITT